jgi:hypothetical protein
MKNIYKGMATAALLATTSFANAGTVSLPNGVSYEAIAAADMDVLNGGGNFNSSFDFVQWWESSDGTEVSLSTMFSSPIANSEYTLNGYGELLGLNDGVGKFNCNGCEITFGFSGLGLDFSDVDVPNPTFQSAFGFWLLANPGLSESDFIADTAGYAAFGSPAQFMTVSVPGFNLTDASMEIYVDYTPDLDALSGIAGGDTGILAAEANAINGGLPWLELSFQEVVLTPKGLTSGVPSDGVAGLSNADTSFGLVATGGEAYSNFAMADDLTHDGEGLVEFVDMIGFGLSGLFSQDAGVYNITSDTSVGTASGIAVTEPTSVAIFGLGLLGFAAASRRKKS